MSDSSPRLGAQRHSAVTVLTAVLTHLEAPAVSDQRAYLAALAPAARFVFCHGGRRADFEELTGADVLYADDPSLRGPHFGKSLNRTLQQIFETWVRDDPAVELIYVIEYDHLILRGDFEDSLRALASQSGAGFFGKAASRRNDSNWSHFLAVREDARLRAFVRGVSERDDPESRWGCLGTGMLFRREALAAFCALDDPPAYYVEMFVPTLLYHLGYDIADVDELGDLYSAIRWIPEFTDREIAAAKRAGRTFVHPVKRFKSLGEDPSTGMSR